MPPKKLVSEKSLSKDEYLKEKLLLDLQRTDKSISRLEISISNHSKELHQKKTDLEDLKKFKDQLVNLQKKPVSTESRHLCRKPTTFCR